MVLLMVLGHISTNLNGQLKYKKKTQFSCVDLKLQGKTSKENVFLTVRLTVRVDLSRSGLTGQKRVKSGYKFTLILITSIGGNLDKEADVPPCDGKAETKSEFASFLCI